MKILIVGAGGVGMTLAALLTDEKHLVSVIARDRHVSRIRKQGIQLWGSLGTISAQPDRAEIVARDLPEEDYDLVLLTVKSFDTASAISACERLIGPRTTIVSVQNGLGNLEAIEAIVGPTQPIFGCVALFGCEISAPATVHISSSTCEAKLGAFGRAASSGREAADKLAAALSEAGLKTVVSETFLTDMWVKFIMNTMTNALSAVEGKTLAELFSDERTVTTMDALLEEIFPVAEQVGVPLPWPSPAEFLSFYTANILPRFANHRTSMSQDLAHGRRTEISALNGHLVKLARDFNTLTPVNAYLTNLVQKKERLTAYPVRSKVATAGKLRTAQYAV